MFILNIDEIINNPEWLIKEIIIDFFKQATMKIDPDLVSIRNKAIQDMKRKNLRHVIDLLAQCWSNEVQLVSNHPYLHYAIKSFKH